MQFGLAKKSQVKSKTYLCVSLKAVRINLAWALKGIVLIRGETLLRLTIE
jgi:hypothetical protein